MNYEQSRNALVNFKCFQFNPFEYISDKALSYSISSLSTNFGEKGWMTNYKILKG